MDLSWLQYLRDGIGLAGLCALLIAVIVLRQQPRGKLEAQAPTSDAAVASGNGTNGKTSKDYVEARIYQHEVNCSRAEEILKRLDRMENKLDKVLGGGR